MPLNFYFYPDLFLSFKVSLQALSKSIFGRVLINSIILSSGVFCKPFFVIAVLGLLLIWTGKDLNLNRYVIYGFED